MMFGRLLIIYTNQTLKITQPIVLSCRPQGDIYELKYHITSVKDFSPDIYRDRNDRILLKSNWYYHKTSIKDDQRLNFERSVANVVPNGGNACYTRKKFIFKVPDFFYRIH